MRGGTAATAILAAALLVPVAVALTQAEPPIADAALFEYYGRAIVHGSRLYVDLWDNKLPGIYLVNAVLQLFFGGRYVVHAVAEALVATSSVALFAFILRRNGFAGWAPAAMIFALFVSVPPASFDSVENFALACILAAYALAFTRLGAVRTLGAGVAIAAAATFWVPSIIMIVPLLILERHARARLAIAASCAAALAVYAALLVAVFGYPVVAELVRSWVVYEGRTLAEHGGGGRLGPLAGLFHGLVTSGMGVLLALLATVLRKPSDDRQRFALAWTACALLAAAVPGNFFAHYFIPSVAPCLFAVAAFGIDLRLTLRRAAFAAAALFFAWRTVVWAVHADQSVHADAREREVVGDRLRTIAGAHAVIDVEPYEPGIFLAADAAVEDRFGMIPRVVAPPVRPGRREPDLIVVLRGAVIPALRSASRPCGGYERWIIYLQRSDDAGLTARCRAAARP